MVPMAPLGHKVRRGHRGKKEIKEIQVTPGRKEHKAKLGLKALQE